MATCLCGSRLASAGSVVVQTLQNALGQKLDVSVRLWVCVNKLQLLQATLLQQHAAIASGCRPKGTIQYCIGKPRVKVSVMFRCVCVCVSVPTVLAADVLHGPSCPQLDPGGVETLQ